MCGQSLIWKVDTGANKTFITTRTYNSIQHKFKPGLRSTKNKFLAANGNTVECDGETTVLLNFAGHDIYFPVVVGGVTENLLGEDFIEQFQCNFDYTDRMFVIQNRGQSVMTTENDKATYQKVVTEVTVDIPPGNEMIVQSRAKVKTSDKHCVLIPENKFVETHNLLVARVLVENGQNIPARVLNPGDSNVRIEKGTVIALLEPVEEVVEYNSESSDSVFRIDETDCERLPEHLQKPFVEGRKDLNLEQTEQFQNTLLRWKNVFARPNEVGRTDVGTHKIKLNDETPIKVAPRKIPLFKRHIIDTEIEKLESKGLIEKSESPWSSQLVLVRKKDNSWRMCVDYRKLNAKTVKDAYPIPRIQDNLDSLNGAQWFTSLDCGMAYHQIPVEEIDRPKTAFATPRGGLYQYVTMPFGLCNAPATFQRIIEKVLIGLQWNILALYLDDIIVFSKSFDLHIKHLETVFERLQMSGLKLNAKKCQFFRKEVTFLGHIVTQDGIKPDTSKTEAVSSIPTPTNISELRKFLGFTSYFRKFVKDYATIAKPLYNLTKKSTDWKWSKECEESFQSLKGKLVSYPVLAYPDIDGGRFILDCDASDHGIGAVLSQEQDGIERVIAYGSRTLNSAEENYCVTRSEMLALVYFTKYFQEYLIGRKFLVRTDHSSLRWLQQFKDPDGQVYRWLEQLSKFDFDIELRKGAKHTNADYMSRVVRGDSVECRQCHMPFPKTDTIMTDTVSETAEVIFDLSVLELGDTSEDEVRQDEIVRERKKRGRKTNKPKPSAARKEPENGIDSESIKTAQREDSDISFIIDLLESGAEKPTWADISDKSPDVKFWIARWELLSIQNGLLCIKWEYTEENVKWRICVPST